MNEAARQRVTSTLDSVQTIFASSVLLNLNTPVKTHLDEVIRFIQDTGFNRDSVFRINGMGPGAQTGRSQLYQRVATSPVEHRMRPWKIVNPSERGMWRAAERWVNGTLVRDDSFKAYARAVSEFGDSPEARAAFGEWWEREGHQLARRQSLGGAAVDADRAYDAIDNGIRLMLESPNVDDAGRWFDELVEAAAKGEPLDVGPERWRKFAEVPGQEKTNGRGLTGALNKSFDVLYGMPSARRGGVIYEHYYLWKKNTLEKAWAGRIIDEDIIVKHGFAQNRLEAREILAMGERSSTIRSMKSGGYRLRSDIEASASAYAKATADSMMYQMGTVSVAGKKLSRLYPWGRAQTDYLGYWAKKLTEPTTFQVQAGTRGIGPAKEVATGVNVRLLDRIGHVANLGTSGEGTEPYSPEWFVQGFSFMPTVLDDSFLVENTMSPGPIASWLVNWLPPDHPLRKGFEELHPQHRIFNDYQNTGTDALGNFADAMVPESPRSLRTLLTTELSAVAAQFGYDPSGFYEFFLGEAEPPQFRGLYALGLGNQLNGGDVWTSLSAGTGQGTPWYDMTEEQRQTATKNAYGRQGMELARKQGGLPSQFADEMQYAKFYLPMENYIYEWVDAGLVSPELADNFTASAQSVADEIRYEEGISSYKDRTNHREFIDAAVDIFYNLPDEQRWAFEIMHPGLSVNMVSWSEVQGRVPDEWASSVSEGKIVVDGSARIDAYRAGRDGGWLVSRAVDDIDRDVANHLNRTASNYLRWVWEELSGEQWSKQTERDGQPTQFGSGVGQVTAEEIARIKPILTELGVDIPAEWGSDQGWTMTAAELKGVLSTARSHFQPDFTIDKTIENGLRSDPDGERLFGDVSDALRDSDAAGYDTPLDWLNIPDDVEVNWQTGSADGDLEVFRSDFRGQIATNPNFTEAMYNDSYARYFGPLDYEPPSPPQESALDVKISGTPEQFDVVDGDTLAWTTPDGERVRFRLMGLNAPDDHETQEGYVQAMNDLQRFLNSHDNVTLGSFESERYGTTQKFKSAVDGKVVEDERIFAWLYVDGVPVWDPAEFGPDNPRGMPSAVAVPRYSELWRRGSGESYEDGV